MTSSRRRQRPSRRPTSSNVTESTVSNSVGGNQTVHNMNNYTIAPASLSQASASRKTPFRCNMPLPTSHYQGREDIFEKILGHFNDVSTQPAECCKRMVTIVGMGGIGKSETACKFANQYRQNYPCAAWIHAESEQSALDSFRSLAKSLKVVSENQQRADLELVKKVYRHIDAEYQDNVLLIFDNAIKLHSDETGFGIFDYLPTEDLANQRFPFVIITSQTPDWQKGIKTIPLEELSEKDSLLFYRSTFKMSSSECDGAFKKLHIQLQGYPLAMNLAASNIDFESDKHSLNWLQDEIELYVKKFEKEDSSILTQKINQNWTNKYSKTLSTVWQLCFQRLRNEPNGANAITLLQAVSFYHVPVNTDNLRWVFTECPFCPGTPDWMKFRNLKESIRLLQKYHLVDCVFKEIDYSDDLNALQSYPENNSEDLSSKFEEEVKNAKSFICELRVHRLVQLVVRLDMDCSVVLDDILRSLAFWARYNYVRQLNVSAVEEAFQRTALSNRALAFVGLLALQGNSAARRTIQSSTAHVEDPAATILRVLQLDKTVERLNEDATEVLSAFVGLSTYEKTLIDKRYFALMALDMFHYRRIFPFTRDDGTSAPGIVLQSITEIEGIACELFSTSCSLTDVCDLPLLCRNVHRANAASHTLLVGNEIIKDLTKKKRPESRIAQLTEELRTYREFADSSNDKWHKFAEEIEEIYKSVDSWNKFESEVESCCLDQLKLKQVFSSIFDKIWLTTDKKNLGDKNRLGYTFKELNFLIYKFLWPQRSREILIALMESFVEILVKTEKEQLTVLQDLRGNTNNAAIWICTIWMKFCIQRDYLGSDELLNCLSRVRILAKIQKISIDRIRDAIQIFKYWTELKYRHEKTYEKFMEMFSESPAEEIRSLVTLCKEIQHEMSVVVKQMGHQT